MLPSTINIFEKAARKAGRILARDFGEIENLQIKSKSLFFVRYSQSLYLRM